MKRLPQRPGKQGPLPEAKTPTLIRMMMAMMIQEGALFVLVKVRDKKGAYKKKKHFQKQHRRAARRMAHGVGGKRGWTAVCECASIEEMLDFTGVISATSVNYSCVLIVWLELTKTTSSTEQTHMHKQHAYIQQLSYN